MSKTVGVIGLGIMGGAMSTSLAERGWTVIGYDPDAARCAELANVGVQIATSAADVARRAPMILTSLPNPAVAASVAAEIASSGAPARIVMETSTLTIEDKEAFRDILAPAGHIALDCPLSGTGAQARNRDLVVYASGDTAAIVQAMPVFSDFARQSVDLGAFGNGSKMKFIANLLVAIHNVAAAEAMVLGMRAGLDPHQLAEIAGSGAGGSRMFQMRAPMMADAVYEPATMRISTWQKDMSIIGDFARQLGCPTPLLDATAPIYTRAYESGLGAQDTAAVCTVLEAMAGLER
jgi:putative dehydrogenase